MSEPTYTCKTCGDTQIVVEGGQKSARYLLTARCKTAGHKADLQYLAGISPALESFFNR